MLVEGLALVPGLILTWPVGVAWHTTGSAVIFLERTLIKSHARLQGQCGVLSDTQFVGQCFLQVGNSLIEVADDLPCHLIAWHASAGLGQTVVDVQLFEQDWEITVSLQFFKIQHRPDDIGLSQIMLDHGIGPGDLLLLVFGFCLIDKLVDVTYVVHAQSTRGRHLPLVLEKHIRITVVSSLVVRPIVEGSHAGPPSTVVAENGAIVV